MTKEADLFGVIEIGGSGVKASVINITAQQAEEIEAKFTKGGEELKYDMLAEEKLRPYPEIETSVVFKQNVPRTVKAVEDFIQRMYADNAVQKENVFVVVSSGVQSLPHIGDLLGALRASDRIVAKNIGAVAPEDECSLTYRWIVPPYRYDEAVVIDIGSSGANACYVENAGTEQQSFRGFALSQFGTKTFAKAVTEELSRRGQDNSPATFAKMAGELRQTLIYPELDVVRGTHPGLETLPRLYLAGGIAWATATLVRPEERTRWVRLSANDFQTIHDRAVEGRAYTVDLDRMRGGRPVREAVAREIQRIARAFNPDQMVAGTEMLIALKHRLRLDRKTRIYFAGVARDGWRSQYLLERIINKSGSDDRP